MTDRPPPITPTGPRWPRPALCLLAALAGLPCAWAQAATLHVGPAREVRTLAEAARLACDGDTVEVDAGDYSRDVAVWQQDRLHLRAVGGRVRLLADGAAAEGKAIWVIRGGTVLVEGFDFQGTRVPSRNGAGIRFEAGSLTVRHCSFTHNEMGLLTSNDPRAELTVENSEFAHNRRADGHNHNLYAGTIARLTVRDSSFHHATVGHLLKSRAAISTIVNSRLVDGPGGSASYELEFPNGGVAVVVGNVIQQNAQTQNPIMISFGAEGYNGLAHTLLLAHNTLVNELPSNGSFLRVMPGNVQVTAVDNRLVGNGPGLESAGAGVYQRNTRLGLQAAARELVSDHRPRAASGRPVP